METKEVSEKDYDIVTGKTEVKSSALVWKINSIKNSVKVTIIKFHSCEQKILFA